MAIPLLELEGTAEEIKQRLAAFAGQRLHVIITPIEDAPETLHRLTIEEKLQALAAEIPPEERAKLPSDLTDNLDHYIYGWPKK
jgi:hypothetical protein